MMKTITNISFLALEFDFEQEGAIRADVFLEVDDDGEKLNMTHKARLEETSFQDFLSPEDVNEVLAPGGSFGSYLQTLRKLIALKVAADLDFKIADLDYVPSTPVGDRIKILEQEKELSAARDDALSERADFIEDVVAEIATQVYQ